MAVHRVALGVDLGTGSVKCALVTPEGQILAKSARSYSLASPIAGWAESDPQEWLAATWQALQDISGAGVNAVAAGFSGQMHGLVLCDAALEPVRPAITWADGRSAAQASRMQEDLGDQIMARLGSRAVAGFAATSLAWVAEHDPGTLARARYALQPKDWLRARLGGSVVTEPSDASGTLLCDVTKGSWDEAAISWAGVDAQLMPPIATSTADAGLISVPSGDLAPRGELPCVVGAADTAAAIHGIGLVAGSGFTAVGSGSQTVSVIADPVLTSEEGTHLFALAGDPAGGWYRIGAVQNAGIALTRALAWLGTTPADANGALAGGVRTNDPIFVPYLAGERTPIVAPDSCGAWLGLSLSTDREAMIRSVVEGVAHAVVLGMNAVEAAGARLPDPLPLLGGGSTDSRFRQLIADIAQRRILPTTEPDAAVIGAALLALRVSREDPIVSLDSLVEPNTDVGDLLAKRSATIVDHLSCAVRA